MLCAAMPARWLQCSGCATVRRRAAPARHVPRAQGKLPADWGYDPLRLGRDRETLLRNREAEVLHSRWAMLGTVFLLVPDLLDVEYVSLAPAVLASVFLVAYTELLRLRHERRIARSHAAADTRVYPGRQFDALGVLSTEVEGPGLGVYSSWLGLGALDWVAGGWWYTRRRVSDVSAQNVLKAAEIHVGRVAMVGFAGILASLLITGDGPVTNLRIHVADPAHTTLLRAFSSSPSPLRGFGDGGQDPLGSAPSLRHRTCRPTCIWGEAVCKALLGDRTGEECDNDKNDSDQSEAPADSAQQPVPFMRTRVET